MKQVQETKVYERKPEGFLHSVEASGTYLNVGGKLLFLKLAHNKSEAGAWGVPGGKDDF